MNAVTRNTARANASNPAAATEDKPAARTVKFTPGSGSLGENLEYSLTDKGILTITIDLNEEQGESASGKSIIVATTGGNQQVPGSTVTVGFNAYRKLPKPK